MDKAELIKKVCTELHNYIALLQWAGDYASAEDAKRGNEHGNTIQEYIEELKKL